MRFEKGVHYPHPPRGAARRQYCMSDRARRARRQNLAKSRLRSDRETLVIKLLIWQACFDGGRTPSQRTFARQLGVWPSYVCKVQKQSERGLDAMVGAQRVTLADLEDARRFTAKLREQESGVLAHVTQSSLSYKPRPMTEGKVVAETSRIAQEEQRQNQLSRRRRVRFTVPVRW